MKYKTLPFSFLSIILFGGCFNNSCSSGDPVCGVRDEPTENIPVDSAFIAFANSIPILRSSTVLKSDDSFDHIDLQSKYIPEGASLIGRLLPFRDHEFIIYSYPADIQLPILEVYNFNGEKVNNQVLFDYGACPITSEGGHVARFSEDFTKIYIETYCSTAFSKQLGDSILVYDLIIPN